MKARILIVDDEAHQRKILVETARLLGHEASETGVPDEALRRARYDKLDLVVTDLRMPMMDGMRLLRQLRLADPSLSVIVVTAHGTVESAVEAMRGGAEDYLLKPIELPAFELVLDRVLKRRELVKENQTLITENALLKRELGLKYHLSALVGRSQASRGLAKAIEGSVASREPVLVIGETGTGKSDLARMIHYNGRWAARSLVFFDCASAPADVVEAQLFGEEIRVGTKMLAIDHPGLLERTHLGTLVLSRIDALSESVQARLARAISEEKSQRVGGQRFFPASVRVIVTATPGELERAVKTKAIHPAILQRLEADKIVIPPLRERREDIAVLVLAYLKNFESRAGRIGMTVSVEALERLSTLSFPGNVRELKELLERAVLRAEGNELQTRHFAPRKDEAA